MFETGRLDALPADGFVAGLAPRHDAAAVALRRTLTTRAQHGFAPADLIARLARAEPPAPPARDAGPRHFSPADRDANPTAGWDPLDPGEPETPFIDPVQDAHAAGFAEGVAAAQAAADQANRRDAALLAGLAETLKTASRGDREKLALRLRQTVVHLVGKLVGELGVSADLLTRRIEAAAEMLADASESALLRLHPDDVALVEGHLPGTIFPVGDAGVTRGSFVLEAASTIVEDGPALWLEQLEAMIDRLPMPQ